MHQFVDLPLMSSREFLILHPNMRSSVPCQKLPRVIPHERRKRLIEEQKVIEKDAYEITHSKGIFGMATSQAEEEEAIKGALPEFEPYDGEET
jgi:hypothetical protein